MEAAQLPVSFYDSDNSSSICHPDSYCAPAATTAFTAALDHPPTDLRRDTWTVALVQLSANLETLLDNDLFSDATISAPLATFQSHRKIPVHRCILSARSPFFKGLFAKENAVGACFEMKDLAKEFEVWADALMVVIGYMYTGRVGALTTEACVCADVECSHAGCGPAVNFMLEVLYASSVFQIPDVVSLFQRRLLDVVEHVSEDDILVVLSVADLCGNSGERLFLKCVEIVVYSKLDIVTLEKALPPYIVKQITASRSELLLGPDALDYPNKHVKRIHQALDSDDVELVRMLLNEDRTSLDDAYALHYAVAHCDTKITMELLDLGIADVNHRNCRGYGVLHVAAFRREPKIIVALLNKGARPLDTTMDGGRKALQISRRLTKLVDYNRPTEKGRPSHKDCLCIEALENAETNHPMVAAVSFSIAGNDLRSKLLYLENRVAIAKQLFPMEAKIAMEIAKVDGTLEFSSDTHGSTVSVEGHGPAVEALNEMPSRINQELLARMNALFKTIEVAKRYFPRCTKVLDELVDKEIAFCENDTSEEMQQKKKRYREIQDTLSKAFYENEDLGRSTMPSLLLSTTRMVGHGNKR